MQYSASICPQSPGPCTRLGSPTGACSSVHVCWNLGKALSADIGCSQPCPGSEATSVLSALLTHWGYWSIWFWAPVSHELQWLGLESCPASPSSGTCIPSVCPAGKLTEFFQEQSSKPSLCHQKSIAKRKSENKFLGEGRYQRTLITASDENFSSSPDSQNYQNNGPMTRLLILLSVHLKKIIGLGPKVFIQLWNSFHQKLHSLCFLTASFQNHRKSFI